MDRDCKDLVISFRNLFVLSQTFLVLIAEHNWKSSSINDRAAPGTYLPPTTALARKSSLSNVPRKTMRTITLRRTRLRRMTSGRSGPLSVGHMKGQRDWPGTGVIPRRERGIRIRRNNRTKAAPQRKPKAKGTVC